MTDKKTICITGGIGSGKSHIIRAFNVLGIPSYDCDSRAKALYDESPELIKNVTDIVGEDIIRDGKLNRALLASRIFGDTSLKLKVESIVHPAVVSDFISWRERQDSQLVIIESAIILENEKLRKIADFTILVTAPTPVRVQRVIARDNITAELALKRIDAQWSDEQRKIYADHIIETNDRNAIIPQIIDIIDKLTK
jgi:dephospho-CoA kinase